MAVPRPPRRWAAAGCLAATTLAVGACGGGSAKGPATSATTSPMAMAPTAPAQGAFSQLVSPRRFAAVIAQPGVTTINVHVPYAGEISGTDLFIPYTRIAASKGRLPARSARLAIYCRSGRMSAIAARTLARLGYRNVVELRGGMDAWRRAGRPLLQRPSA